MYRNRGVWLVCFEQCRNAYLDCIAVWTFFWFFGGVQLIKSTLTPSELP